MRAQHAPSTRGSGLLVVAASLCVVAFAGCSMFTGVYEGDVFVETADDISGLEGITEITGNLVIDGTSLTTLAGLEGLTKVAGDVAIGGDRGNGALTSLDGLANLSTIDGQLIVRKNPALPNLAGLAALTGTGDAFSVVENSLLSTLGPLPAFTRVGYFMNIERNQSLVDVGGIENLVFVDFTLSIDSNVVLQNLAGFAGLREAGRLFVRDNIALSTCAAYALRDQLLAVNGMGRYDGLVDIARNLDDEPCE